MSENPTVAQIKALYAKHGQVPAQVLASEALRDKEISVAEYIALVRWTEGR